jgi:hypothetical protein
MATRSPSITDRTAQRGDVSELPLGLLRLGASAGVGCVRVEPFDLAGGGTGGAVLTGFLLYESLQRR